VAVNTRWQNRLELIDSHTLYALVGFILIIFTAAFTGFRLLSLSWARSVRSMPSSHFLKIHLKIILPSTPENSKWSPSLRIPHQNHVCTFLFPQKSYMSRSSHSCFDQSNNIWLGAHICNLLISHCFKPLLIGNMPDKCLSTRTLL